MTNLLLQTIDGIQEILGICPCCGELFRLAEAKFIFPSKRATKSLYQDVVDEERKIAARETELSEAELEFKEQFDAQKETIRTRAREAAKRKLIEIDRIFSANGVDPQDVRAILHPIEYVTFHGLNAAEGVTCIEFISRAPASRAQEIIVGSIDHAVGNGDVEFETLRLQTDCTFERVNAFDTKRRTKRPARP